MQTNDLNERIDKALVILRNWHLSAKWKKNTQAMANVELIEGVIKDLSGR